MKTNIITFPCVPGDIIYDIYEFVNETPFPNPEMSKWEVKCIGFQYDKKGRLLYNIDGRVIPPDEFGKTIFLSEAEALENIKNHQLL